MERRVTDIGWQGDGMILLELAPSLDGDSVAAGRSARIEGGGGACGGGAATRSTTAASGAAISSAPL